MSDSVVQTEAAPLPGDFLADEPQALHRVTIFERQEIMAGLSPVVIGAIQREMVELRSEFEKKLLEHEERFDKRVGDLLNLASSERLDLERMRLENARWETGTEGSSSSRK